MSLIYDWGFYVAPEREEAFRAWLAENEPKLAELAPKSYEYLGTFRPLWGEATGDYHQMWRYGSERPPDLRRAAADTGGAFTELARQYLSFVDETRAAEETFRLYRSVLDKTRVPPPQS